MNRILLNAIERSGIVAEVLVAAELVSANRATPTPAVLVAFTGYVEPATTPTNTERNTAILAMLAHYALTTI